MEMDLWKYLKQNKKPVVLYGTGNGAEKIIRMLDAFNIKVSGIFASDGFVRGKIFNGFPVTSYAEAKSKFGDMIVLVCFGSDREDVISNIRNIALEQELYMPDVPVITGEDGSFDIFDEQYEADHRAELERVFSLLSDEKSRDTFRNIVEYKKSGKIDYLFNCESPEDEIGNILKLGDKESYLDLGAYTGDTVREFIKACDNKYNAIYAFEPDGRNFRKLTENTAGLKDCYFYNLAVSDKNETLYFLKNSGRGGSKNGSEAGRSKLVEINADSVDNVIAERPCSFIKFDVEGQEYKAISGAERTIRIQSPKMIIAAYHRTEDLFAIPLQVLNIDNGYKIYLRHTPCLPAWEVNYIFIKEN